MKRTRLLIPALATAAALGVAAPALADGTIHYLTAEECFDDNGYRICFGNSGKYHRTVTPSGNETVTGEGTTNYSVTGPGYSQSSDYSYRFHFLVKRGEVHVQSQKSSETFTMNGQTCDYTEHFQIANGHIQFNRPTINCS